MSSLATVQTQFASYDSATVEQTVIKAVLAVYINADPQYPDNECISYYALLRMRPLSTSCAEGFVVISCGKVDYDKSGWRDD
jgi:hypothetical protein